MNKYQESQLDIFMDGPWRYDLMGCLVYAGDPDDMVSIVANIRGHGFLTGEGHGALGLPEETAVAIQDKIGRRISKVPDMLKVLSDIFTRYELPYGDKSKIRDILSECEYGNFAPKK